MATAAAIAGTAAVGAYLNAKYHVAKDLRELYITRRARTNLEKASTYPMKHLV